MNERCGSSSSSSSTSLDDLFILLTEEKRGALNDAPYSAIGSLLWLKRGLQFILVFLTDINAGEPSLRKSAKRAYRSSLASHHGTLAKTAFDTALLLATSRDKFLERLTGSGKEFGGRELSAFLVRFGGLVQQIEDFYMENGWER